MVKIIRDKILDHTGTDWVPIVVVGNKSDLHIQRQVSVEEGKALAAEWKCSWTEASARHNENVARAFELIISEVEKQENPCVIHDLMISMEKTNYVVLPRLAMARVVSSLEVDGVRHGPATHHAHFSRKLL